MKKLLLVLILISITVLPSCALKKGVNPIGADSEDIVWLGELWAIYMGYESANDYYNPDDNYDYKQGINKAISEKHYSEIENGVGFGVGFGVDVPISEKFGVAPAVQFLGSKDLKLIQAPILARYEFADKFNAYAGPNIGFLIDPPTGLNTFNFALDIGVSYDISDNFIVEARYDWGITDLADNDFSSFKVNNFMVGVGYRFKKKK